MADIVSLSKARKAKDRVRKETIAAENRVKFGRTKAEKLAEETRNAKDQKSIDGHKREP